MTWHNNMFHYLGYEPASKSIIVRMSESDFALMQVVAHKFEPGTSEGAILDTSAFMSFLYCLGMHDCEQIQALWASMQETVRTQRPYNKEEYTKAQREQVDEWTRAVMDKMTNELTARLES